MSGAQNGGRLSPNRLDRTLGVLARREIRREKKIERHRYWGFLSETATKSWASKCVVEQISSRLLAHAAAETLDVLVAEEIEPDHT